MIAFVVTPILIVQNYMKCISICGVRGFLQNNHFHFKLSKLAVNMVESY